MKTLIEVHNLTKSYPKHIGREHYSALKDVSLTVSEGQSFGLLGLNGAGKTTLMKIMLGLSRTRQGSVRILGSSAREYHVKKSIGYLPEHVTLYPYLTGGEFLDLVARLYGLHRAERRARITETLRLVGLTRDAKKHLRTYSKGMLQRIGLAQAIIHHPKLLLLDEPLDGLDPIGRHEMKTILLNLRGHGVTIMLNSHILSDVEELCDTIGILHHGKLLMTGAIKNIVKPGQNLEQFFVHMVNAAK